MHRASGTCGIITKDLTSMLFGSQEEENEDTAEKYSEK